MSSTSRPARPKRTIPTHRLLPWVLLLFTVVPPIASGSYISAMPQAMETFTESPGRVQLALTSNLLGMAVGQPAVRPIADRSGRRRPLVVSLAVSVLATLACAVAPVVGTWWLRFGDWRGMFVACAGLSAVCLVAALALVPETLARGSRTIGGLRTLLRTIASILRRPLFLGYGASRGLAYAVVVAVLAPAITVRIGAQTTLLCGFVGSGLGSASIVLSALTDGPAAVTVAGMVVALWCLGLVIGTSSGLAMEQVRDVAGTGSSVVGGTMFGVGALISMMVALGDLGESLSVGLIMVMCGAAGACITVGLRTRGGSRR